MLAIQAQALYSKFSQSKTLVSLFQILAGSLLLALAAQIAVPLYFSPVPVTGQTLAIMFIGATLGSRKALLTVLAYLAEGALGLPVFSCATSGLASLLGLKAGYFFGFAIQAYLVGLFFERQKTFSLPAALVALFSIDLLQLSLGALWLSLFVGVKSAMAMGFYPFILGETVKVLLAATSLYTRAGLRR